MKHWKQITDRMAMVCLDTQKLPQDLQCQCAFFGNSAFSIGFPLFVFQLELFHFLMNIHHSNWNTPTTNPGFFVTSFGEISPGWSGL